MFTDSLAEGVVYLLTRAAKTELNPVEAQRLGVMRDDILEEYDIDPGEQLDDDDAEENDDDPDAGDDDPGPDGDAPPAPTPIAPTTTEVDGNTELPQAA